MSFKWFLGVLALVITQWGCGLRIFESPAPQEPVRLEALDREFDLHAQLKAFAQGRISEEELDEAFDYLDEILLGFVARVRGASRGQLLADEVRGFVHRFILRERALPLSLMTELMELKVFLVGGDQRSISHEDFKKLRLLLRRVQVEAQRMRPFMGFFVGFDPSAEMAAPARQALEVSAVQLAEILSEGERVFYFDHLERLIVELRQFVGWEKAFPSSRQPEDWVMFVRLFAEMMGAGDRNSIQPQSWPQLTRRAVETYGLWIRYQYDLVGPNVFYGPGLEALTLLVEDGLRLAHGIVRSQPDLVIEYDRLAEVFSVLEKLRLLPAQVTAESLDKVTREMVSKVFGDRNLSPSQRSRTSIGISGYELHRIGAEFSRWSVVQSYLDRMFSEGEVEGAADFSVMSPLDQLSSGRMEPEGAVDLAIQEFRELIGQMRPLFSSKLGRIFLVEEVHFEKHSVAHGFFNLSAVNLLQSLLRLMFRGYSEDFERARTLAGLTENEMQNFYTDFRPLGIDLRVMDPRSVDSGRRSFFEANMFTYSGRGIADPSRVSEAENLLEMTVAIEFLSLLFSGGLMAHSLYQDLHRACRPPGARFVPIDVFGEEMLNRDCVSRNLLRILIPHVNNMPGLQNYLQEELTRDQGQQFAEILIAAGVYHLSPQHLIERAEINTMSMVLHYSEVIFTRFNLDGGSHLTHSEILEAFPNFSGFVKKLAADMCVTLSDQRAQTVYLYILNFAEIPKFDATTLRRIAMMRWPWWSMSMDRMQVVKVFGEMIRSTGATDALCETP